MTETSEENLFRVIKVIKEAPDLSQRQIAARARISIGGVNYCLKALVHKGFVKVCNFRTSDNRLRYAYVLTPRGLREKTRLAQSFLQRKLVEYEALMAEIATLEQEARGGGRTDPATGPEEL
ncbi:MarR family EPS-associated transcriptional regulator [Mameliella sp. CS4]|uniref:MarR family EPS-associated transcriptional regulator n=1 Tax=Mameliella sp. CS4 TaxID=2862329 RepID=UPI001C5D5EDD|nr:MarR family EPS-associated transcriptional regulator [Mameliella sp. CS4]MBW4985713.1 MarR family EPS-associated transcriptional regulator [Mameliella sp. CS4]